MVSATASFSCISSCAAARPSRCEYPILRCGRRGGRLLPGGGVSDAKPVICAGAHLCLEWCACSRVHLGLPDQSVALRGRQRHAVPHGQEVGLAGDPPADACRPPPGPEGWGAGIAAASPGRMPSISEAGCKSNPGEQRGSGRAAGAHMVTESCTLSSRTRFGSKGAGNRGRSATSCRACSSVTMRMARSAAAPAAEQSDVRCCSAPQCTADDGGLTQAPPSAWDPCAAAATTCGLPAQRRTSRCPFRVRWPETSQRPLTLGRVAAGFFGFGAPCLQSHCRRCRHSPPRCPPAVGTAVGSPARICSGEMPVSGCEWPPLHQRQAGECRQPQKAAGRAGARAPQSRCSRGETRRSQPRRWRRTHQAALPPLERRSGPPWQAAPAVVGALHRPCRRLLLLRTLTTCWPEQAPHDLLVLHFCLGRRCRAQH